VEFVEDVVKDAVFLFFCQMGVGANHQTMISYCADL